MIKLNKNNINKLNYNFLFKKFNVYLLIVKNIYKNVKFNMIHTNVKKFPSYFFIVKVVAKFLVYFIFNLFIFIKLYH